MEYISLLFFTKQLNFIELNEKEEDKEEEYLKKIDEIEQELREIDPFYYEKHVD